jgi:hypothetical protein
MSALTSRSSTRPVERRRQRTPQATGAIEVEEEEGEEVDIDPAEAEDKKEVQRVL